MLSLKLKQKLPRHTQNATSNPITCQGNQEVIRSAPGTSPRLRSSLRPSPSLAESSSSFFLSSPSSHPHRFATKPLHSSSSKQTSAADRSVFTSCSSLCAVRRENERTRERGEKRLVSYPIELLCFYCQLLRHSIVFNLLGVRSV